MRKKQQGVTSCTLLSVFVICVKKSDHMIKHIQVYLKNESCVCNYVKKAICIHIECGVLIGFGGGVARLIDLDGGHQFIANLQQT